MPAARGRARPRAGRRVERVRAIPAVHRAPAGPGAGATARRGHRRSCRPPRGLAPPAITAGTPLPGGGGARKRGSGRDRGGRQPAGRTAGSPMPAARGRFGHEFPRPSCVVVAAGRPCGRPCFGGVDLPIVAPQGLPAATTTHEGRGNSCPNRVRFRTRSWDKLEHSCVRGDGTDPLNAPAGPGAGATARRGHRRSCRPPRGLAHPAYEAPLPEGHRFPMGKYGRLAETLRERGLVPEGFVPGARTCPSGSDAPPAAAPRRPGGTRREA
jgi:hypothetical protein